MLFCFFKPQWQVRAVNHPVDKSNGSPWKTEDTETGMSLRPRPWLLPLLLLVLSPGLSGLELPGGEADSATSPSAANTLVWGPGLEANVVLPARFFFVQAVDSSGRKWVTLGFSPFSPFFQFSKVENVDGKRCCFKNAPRSVLLWVCCYCKCANALFFNTWVSSR